MSYGLDFSDCRFLTDHKGNKLRADIPYAMFSMLIECRQAALAAQTRQIERTTRPGMYKGSLGGQPGGPGEPPSINSPDAAIAMQPVPNTRAGGSSRSREQLEALFSAPAVPVETSVESDAPPPGEPASDAPLPPASNGQASQSRYIRHTFFPREFCAPIPDEVAAAIAGGIYFLRAWREYRRYETRDTAEFEVAREFRIR